MKIALENGCSLSLGPDFSSTASPNHRNPPGVFTLHQRGLRCCRVRTPVLLGGYRHVARPGGSRHAPAIPFILPAGLWHPQRSLSQITRPSGVPAASRTNPGALGTGEAGGSAWPGHARARLGLLQGRGGSWEKEQVRKRKDTKRLSEVAQETAILEFPNFAFATLMFL